MCPACLRPGTVNNHSVCIQKHDICSIHDIWSKIKEKIKTKCLKQLNNTFSWKIRPPLGSSISGTKCDRDKPIFFCRNRIENLKNGGHHHRTSLPCPSMGVPSPGDYLQYIGDDSYTPHVSACTQWFIVDHLGGCNITTEFSIIMYRCTAKPVMTDHFTGPQKVVLYDRWCFIRGTNV